MDVLGLVSVPGWLLALLTVLLSIYLYGKRKHSYFDRLGIPAMKGAFMLGDLPIAAKRGFTYIDADLVKEYGKVFGIYIGNTPSLVVCDTAIIKEILVKQFNKFTDRGDLVPSHKRWKSALNIATGSHWKFLRSTLSPTFSSGKMRSLTGSIQQCLENFHEVLEEKRKDNPDGLDIVPLLKGFTMDVICNAGFGIEVNAQRDPDNTFVRHARKFLEFRALRVPVFMTNLIFPDLRPLLVRLFPTNIIPKDSFEYLRTATMSAFSARKQTNSNFKDLLQLMINAHKGETSSSDLEGSTFEEFKKRGLTDDEVLVNSIVFMSAGYETTATALSWFVYDLAVHPDVQERLIEEIDAEVKGAAPTYDIVFKLKYLDMVMNETLRMHTPGTRFDRRAAEDVEINGIRIKKGLLVTFSARAMHFLPDYWENPNEYNPDRFAPENQDKLDPYAFMPFGHGPRHCVAMRLAHLEIKMTIVSLLQKYRIVKTEELKVPMPPQTQSFWKPSLPVVIKAVYRTPGH